MMNKLLSSKAIYTFAILFFAGVFYFLFSLTTPKTALAQSYTPLGTNVFPSPDSSSPRELYMAVGIGEFEQGIAAAVITVDNPGTYTATIEEARFCNDDDEYTYQALDLPQSSQFLAPYFETIFQVRDRSKNDLGTPVSSGFTPNCTSRNQTITFTVDSGDWDNRIGKYAVYFTGSIGAFNVADYGPVEPTAAENSFRIRLDGSIIYPATENIFGDTFFNLANRNRPVNEAINYTLDLSVACEVTTPISFSLELYDVDQGVYQGVSPYQTLSYRISRALKTYGNFRQIYPSSGTQPITGATAGDSQTYQFASISMSNEYVYRFEILGLSTPNAITYGAGVQDIGALFADDMCDNTLASCAVNSITRLSDGGTIINPGDRIQFNITVTGASGYEIGVNGPNYGNEYYSTNISNYLVSASSYARGPSITSNNFTTTVSTIQLNVNGATTSSNMNAPNTVQNDIDFNWGLVIGGFGWLPITCNGSFDVVTADVCDNIPNDQTDVPTNYVEIDNNCYRPATCSNNSFDAWNSEPRVFTTTVTSNDEYSTLTIEVDYRVGGSTTWNNADPSSIDIVAEGDEDFDTSSITSTGNINWRVLTFTGSDQVGTTQTCTSTVTRHTLPTCRVLNTTFPVGAWRQTRVQLRFAAGDTWRGNSADGATINVADDVTRYRYNDGNASVGTTADAANTTYSGTTLGSALEGQSTRTGTTYITLSADSRTATQATDHRTRVTVPGLYGDSTARAVVWTVDWRDGNYNPPNLTCRSNLSVTIQPLVCTPTSNPFSINVPSRASTSLENNNAIDVRVYVDGDLDGDGNNLSSTFSAPTAVPPTNGNIIVNRIDTTPGSAVGASAARGYETDRDLTYDATGIYLVEWTIRTQYAAVDSDGNPHPLYSANPTDASCSDTEIEVSRRPYMRLYGNDVVAGSVLLGSGEECTTAGLTSVDDVGITSVGNVNEDGYYQGSTAEMAAIATGTISNFLPGTGSFLRSGEEVYPSTPLRATQEITSGYDYLAIAGGGTGILDIGGNYDGGGLCNTIFPDPDEFDDTGSIKAGSDFRDGDRIDPDGIDDLQGNVPVNGTSGTRARIFVIGDVTIVGNITYEGADSWASTEQIPLFALYATGDITINGDVSYLDGLYVAGGDIHTCSEFMETTDPAEVSAVNAACGAFGSAARQLTLRGAFVANNIVFGRTPGDVSFSNDNPLNADGTLFDPETGFAGGRKAERLHFYPELYIALWDLERSKIGAGGGGDPAGSFDYISSPPPVF